MSYIDGFVIPVPTKNKEAYRAASAKWGGYMKEYGALQMVEAWGDDVPDGKSTDFKMAVKATPEETVVFSWVVWPSKQVRDEANEKMKNDPRMASAEMPFDGKRMIFGGFDVLSDTKF
ncbi:MAG TPA: DUF1428 domain-containing protein [Candidatus Limnocylindrales bacterium]|nr:DUF1428 domain-containing protein [Candidatus Limnocylindrales bacterium]